MNNAVSVSPLTDLAARIRTEHAAAISAIRRGAEHAMAAGDLLIEAKCRLRHGHWGKWLEANCAISDRTARLYVSLAQNRAAIETEANRQRVADFTVRGAVKAIAGPPKAKETPKAPAPRQSAPKRRQSQLEAPSLNSLIWSEADEETQRRFLDDIGLRSFLDRIPDNWIPALERWVEERLQAEIGSSFPDDLSIPDFLREPAP